MQALWCLFLPLIAVTGQEVVSLNQVPWGCTRTVYNPASSVSDCRKACTSSDWCGVWRYDTKTTHLGDTGCMLFRRCLGSKYQAASFTGMNKGVQQCGGQLWAQPLMAPPSAIKSAPMGPLPVGCRQLSRQVVIKPRPDPTDCGHCETCDCKLPTGGYTAENRRGRTEQNRTGWWVSASQSREDQALYYRYFCRQCGGVFVEMGGFDGLKYSNSLFFERALGWKGVLIEADPKNLVKLKVNRPRSEIIGKAACPAGQDRVTFFGGGATGAVSGVVDNAADSFKKKWWGENWTRNTVSVPCAPLGTLLKEAGVTFIDLFSLDVEGGEEFVLRTMDWSIPVRVWVIEMDAHNVTKNEVVTNMLLKNGYRRAENDWSVTRFCGPKFACMPNEVFEHPKYVSRM
eukprot:Hpha_TRINITY_DN15646_c3_g1::TRINITY_DN15646_c3_g1_i3::g.100169::m.100169